MQAHRTSWRSPRKLHFDPQKLTIAMALVVGAVVADRLVLTLFTSRPAPPAVEAPVKAKATTIATTHWAAESEEALAIVEELVKRKDTRVLEALAEKGMVRKLEPGQEVLWIGSGGYLGSRIRVKLKESGAVVWTQSGAIR